MCCRGNENYSLGFNGLAIDITVIMLVTCRIYVPRPRDPLGAFSQPSPRSFFHGCEKCSKGRPAWVRIEINLDLCWTTRWLAQAN